MGDRMSGGRVIKEPTVKVTQMTSYIKGQAPWGRDDRGIAK